MLGCIQPMSSPMMNRMLGFRPPVDACCAVTPLPWSCLACDTVVGAPAGDALLSRSCGAGSEADDVFVVSQPVLANETAAASSADEVKKPRVGFNVSIEQPPLGM